MCFDAPSWYELVVEGKKVAGSAQTRQKGVILQHGAILMSLDVDKLTSIFTYSSPALKERVRRTLPDRAIAIDRLTDRDISVNECKEAFSKGFEESLDISLEPLELTAEQLALVHQIEKEKYANDEWNFKK